MPTVNSVSYNKPVLPRVSDTSDLASNRANVYSGKGLDFDGVNDDVVSTISVSGAKTYCVWINADATTNERIISISSPNYSNVTFTNNKFSMYDGTNIPQTTTTFEIGKWYFVAFVQEANNAKIYVNGVSQPLDTTSWNEHTHTNKTIAIGRDANGGAYYDGKISGVRVFDTVLTATQVAELYNNPEQILPTGVSAINLKLWLPMMEGAGSYVYNGAAGATGTELVSNGGFDEVCQKWGLSDVATIAITGGKAVWTNPASGGAFADQYISATTGKTYRVTFDYSASDSGFVYIGNQYVSIPSGSGTFITDITYTSGSARVRLAYGSSSALTASIDNVSVKEVVPQATGTISGATWVKNLPEPLPQTALINWNRGKNLFSNSEVASPASMTATADYTYAPNGFNTADLSLETSTTSFSDAATNTVSITANTVYRLSAYVKPAGRNYIYLYTNAGSGNGLVAKFDIANGTYLGSSPSGSYVYSAFSSYGISDAGNGWYYVYATFSYGSSTTRYFAIGVNDNSTANIAPYAGNTSLGVYTWGFQLRENTYGDVYVPTYGSAQISPITIPQGLVAGKDIFDNSIVKSKSSGSFNFDGNSYAAIPDNGTLYNGNTFTVEAWIYPSSDQTGTHRIINKWDTGYPQRTFQLSRTARSIFLYISNGSNALYAETGNDITYDAWNHVVGTYDGSTIRVYVNAVEEASFATGSYTLKNSTEPILIGAYSSLEETYDEIANPRIYNYALTAEQVSDNYNQKATTVGATKTDSELQAYINRTVSAGATVEAHSCLLDYLTELDNK